MGTVRDARYDALVVGGGPAGSIAALNLARAGARVLLLERHAIGRDKPCGGGLTPRAWRNLEVPIHDLISARVDTAEIRYSRGASVTVPLREQEVRMVRRRDLDARLVSAAAHAGTVVHDREAALTVEARSAAVRVGTSSGTYCADTVLLATGAEGGLAAAAGLSTKSSVMAVGLEIDAPARADHLAQRRLIFDYAIPGGYAWAFPKGECWNTGVLTTRKDVAPQLRRRLAAFVSELGVEYSDADGAARPRGHRIPLHERWLPVVRGNVALLGDAAGLADRLYGEGIAEAFASGRLAAAAVLRMLAGRARTLDGYQLAMQQVLGTHLRRMRWLARAVYAHPRFAVRALGLAPNRAMARRLSTEPFTSVADTLVSSAA